MVKFKLEQAEDPEVVSALKVLIERIANQHGITGVRVTQVPGALEIKASGTVTLTDKKDGRKYKYPAEQIIEGSLALAVASGFSNIN